MNMNRTVRVYSAVAALTCGLSALPATVARAQATPVATAAEKSTSTITLETVLDAAYEHNPELSAYRQKYQAAMQVPKRVRSLPDPVVSASAMTSETETKAGPVKGKVSISEKFPFYGKRKLKGEIAGKDAEVAYQAWRAKKLDIAARTAGAYYGLYFLDRAVDILTEQAELLKHFARVAEKKYSVGRHPQTNVFRAQVEMALILNDVITLKHKRKSALSKLNALLDRPSRSPLDGLVAPPHPDFRWTAQELSSLSLKNRPELKALEALEGKSRAAARLAVKNYFPDLTLGFEHTFIGAGTTAMPYDGRDSQGVMLSVNVPLWFGKNKAGVEEARKKQEAARLSRRDLANRTVAQVEELVVIVETHARSAQLYRDTILPQARAALRSAGSAYEADKLTFLEFLDSERSLLKFELEFEKHLVDYAAGLYELQRMVGAGLHEKTPGGRTKQ